MGGAVSFDQPVRDPDDHERDAAAQELADREAITNGTMQGGSFDVNGEDGLSVTGVTFQPKRTKTIGPVQRRAALQESPPSRSVFLPFAKLPLRAHDWLIDRYLERGALATLIGETGSFKSFLSIDMAVCIAAGKDWHGRRVKQGAVFVIVGEGQGGIRRRVAAAMKAHAITGDVPIYFTERAYALDDEASAETIMTAIREVGAQTGQTPALVIVDTLARCIRGDENSTRDMGAFVRAVARIRDETGAAMLLVHHVGHAAKDRERGAYSLGADMDYRYLVKRDGDTLTATLEAIKSKDDEPPPPLRLTLSTVPVGMQDERGKEVASLAVQSVTATTLAKRKALKVGRRPEKRDAMIEAIRLAAQTDAQTIKRDGREVRAVSLDAVRAIFRSSYVPPNPEASKATIHDSRQKAAKRSLDALVAQGRITVSDGMVTVNGEDEPDIPGHQT